MGKSDVLIANNKTILYKNIKKLFLFTLYDQHLENVRIMHAMHYFENLENRSWHKSLE